MAYARSTSAKYRQHALANLTGAVVFLLLAAASSDAQPRPPQEQRGVQRGTGVKIKRWPVKVLEEGGAVTRRTLKINPPTVALKQDKGPGEEILISTITDVTYDNSSHRKSRRWLHAAGDIDKSPLVLGVYPVAAPLAVAVLAAPFKTKSHFVYISFDDAGFGSTEVCLEIGKAHYAGVLAELQRLTGKPWRNLPEEQKKRRNVSRTANTTNSQPAGSN